MTKEGDEKPIPGDLCRMGRRQKCGGVLGQKHLILTRRDGPVRSEGVEPLDWPERPRPQKGGSWN